MNNIYGTTPDRYGFSRYSIAVHTPDDLTKTIMTFRADIGLATTKLNTQKTKLPSQQIKASSKGTAQSSPFHSAYSKPEP